MTLADKTTPASKFNQYVNIAAPLFQRDMLGRYRGSVMGLAWTFFVPLLMLAIFTFMFGTVFQMRWAAKGAPATDGTLGFALTLFIGLITHSFISEVITRAPSIIVSNANMVKRLVFPLEIFPVMVVSTALLQYFVGLFIFLAFKLFVTGSISIGALWLPVIILPFTILLCGISWLIAGASVYLRDIGQLMGLAATVLLFMSPVFYPLSMLPDHLWPIFMFNPLTFIIEQSRHVVFTGTAPDWTGLAIYYVVSLGVAAAGFAAFQRMRRGFSDVL
ncbi:MULTISPECIES: ABC transporter permease [unclassified Roseibium]|uniref:ABC transporter permease n=1 Tax=unclassified Roseibium TaxID=2629323 RepID=UPI00273D8AFB|nr:MULTISPECIES: ABC transporter permease [unclassified Roseibium]